jgi:hypothetical protein
MGSLVRRLHIQGSTGVALPSNVNHRLAEEIEPRRYQTNANLSQPPTTGADRPVREYVTNVRGGPGGAQTGAHQRKGS